MRAEKTANLLADVFREGVRVIGLDRVRLFGAGARVAAVEEGTQIAYRIAATPALIENAKGTERIGLKKAERILPSLGHAGPRGEMKHMIDRAVWKLVGPDVKTIGKRQRMNAVPERRESLHEVPSDEPTCASNDECAFAVRYPTEPVWVRLRHPLSFVRRIGQSSSAF